MVTRSKNQGMLGHPGGISMILLLGQSCNFTTLPKMAAGGKAYGSRSSDDRLSALPIPGGPELVRQTPSENPPNELQS